MLKDLLAKYPNATEHVWCQEEPRNTGAYLFIADTVRTKLGIELIYIGRRAAASPAVGSKTAHKHEQEDILKHAIGEIGSSSTPTKSDVPPKGVKAGKAVSAR
jgi:2-oxoglutarate dehydrogenase E1 component